MPRSEPVAAQQGALERTARLFARRKWVIITCLVLVPALALAFSLSQDERYEASASLLFREQANDLLQVPTGGNDDPARKAATNTELVALPVVAERAARQLPGIPAGVIAASVEVDSSELSDVIKVIATADTAQLAARIANAYASAFVVFRREADRNSIERAIALVQTNYDALTPERAAGREGQLLQDRLESLQLAQSLQTGNAELVQRATPPSDPSSPKTKLNLILGLFAGAVLGLGLAALFERLDRRMKNVEDLESAYGLPVLARVPRMRSLTREGSMDRHVPEEVAEAYRALRVNLRYFTVDDDLRSVLVASPLPKEGKSTITLQLAMTMASMGDNVVLVQADLRKPAQSPGPSFSLGLSGALVGATTLDEALLPVSVTFPHLSDSSLCVLPAGPPPPNPLQLLESERMSSFLKELEDRFDIVLIDSPALSVVSDAWALVPRVSGILVVAAVNSTTRDAASQFSKQISMLGGRMLGLVANFARIERRQYRYGYGEPLPQGLEPGGLMPDEPRAEVAQGPRRRATS